MSCECDIGGTPVMPFQCVLVGGFKVDHIKKTVPTFDGDIVMADRIESVATVFLERQADMEILKQWYFDEINEGEIPFKITLPIFGNKKEVAAKMTNRLNASNFGASSNEVSFNLSIDTEQIKEFICEVC